MVIYRGSAVRLYTGEAQFYTGGARLSGHCTRQRTAFGSKFRTLSKLLLGEKITHGEREGVGDITVLIVATVFIDT